MLLKLLHNIKCANIIIIRMRAIYSTHSIIHHSRDCQKSTSYGKPLGLYVREMELEITAELSRLTSY